MCDSININKYLLVLEELQNIKLQKGNQSYLNPPKTFYLSKCLFSRSKSRDLLSTKHKLYSKTLQRSPYK